MHHRDQTGNSRVRVAGSAARFPALALLWQAVLMAAATAELLWARSRQRRVLSGFDEFMLKDIGLSRADVEHEIRRSLWH